MDYSLISEEQIKNRFELLPEKLKQVLTSDFSVKKLRDICKANGLDKDETLVVEQLVVLTTILGFIRIDEMSDEIADLLFIDQKLADKLAEEIKNEIISPIETEVKKNYAPLNVAPAEKKAEIISTPVSKPVEPLSKETTVTPSQVVPVKPIAIPTSPERLVPLEATIKPVVAPTSTALPVTPSVTLASPVAAKPAPFILHKEEAVIKPTTEVRKTLELNFKESVKALPPKPVTARFQMGEKTPAATTKVEAPKPVEAQRVVHYTEMRTPVSAIKAPAPIIGVPASAPKPISLTEVSQGVTPGVPRIQPAPMPIAAAKVPPPPTPSFAKPLEKQEVKPIVPALKIKEKTAPTPAVVTTPTPEIKKEVTTERFPVVPLAPKPTTETRPTPVAVPAPTPKPIAEVKPISVSTPAPVAKPITPTAPALPTQEKNEVKPIMEIKPTPVIPQTTPVPKPIIPEKVEVKYEVKPIAETTPAKPVVPATPAERPVVAAQPAPAPALPPIIVEVKIPEIKVEASKLEVKTAEVHTTQTIPATQPVATQPIPTPRIAPIEKPKPRPIIPTITTKTMEPEKIVDLREWKISEKIDQPPKSQG